MADRHVNNKKKKKASTTSIIILFTVITIVAVIVGSLWLIVDHYLNLINYVDPNDTSHYLPSDATYPYGDDTDTPATGEPFEGEVVWPGAGDITDLEDDELLNILIVGQDRREGQEDQLRSDSMILASINPETYEVSLISFLRDTYLQIPGYQDNRLNVSYMYGGFKLLKETLSHYFMDIIEILGGVDIELTQAEADYIYTYSGSWVPAGMNRLTPEQALVYARNRKIGDDFGRTERQRKILLSIFNEFKDADVGELKRIAEQILPMVTTDMSKSQVLGLLTELLPNVRKMKISQHFVPDYDCFQGVKIRGMDVLLPDLKLIREKLATEYLPF